MKARDYIFYGACLLIIGAAAYLSRTKEMVCQTYIDRIENKGRVAHVIKQEDNFHFRNLKFPARTHFIAQTYAEDGNHVEKRKTFKSEQKARRFVNKTLENLK